MVYLLLAPIIDQINLRMDLQKALLKDHSKAQASQIADYVGHNRALFKQLVYIYLAGPYGITQRAAWPISICVERHPELAIPHLKTILKHLNKVGIHNAVKRNTMRLLQFVDIPKPYHGRVADICFRYLHDKKAAIAVKACSMTVLTHIVKQEPELGQELRIIIEDRLPYSSPGFAARARKVLKDLDKRS